MTEHQSSRTIVKSPPELWAECSDAGSLARHLGSVGEIRITRLEPESTVAWEGAAARGTVEIEPAGWGTRVTLTMTSHDPPETVASIPEPATVEPEPGVAASEPAAVEPEPVVAAPEPASVEPEPPSGAKPRRGLARLLGWRRSVAVAPEEVAVAAAPVAAAPEPSQTRPEPASAGPNPETPEEALAAALDSLGRAHHRPYSRA